ncbi:AMP-dependent synthetase [Enterobacteriaceae bacterium ESL0689]|nr:AMP-dependent synthetase [Enterobacteriaceae bacterium ESL0689]
MNQTLSLSQWLTAPRPVTTPVAWLGEDTWTLGHLRHDVALVIDHLRQQPGNRWGLCFENSYLFIVALLATLHSGKIPVIPGHNRAVLLNAQRALFDGILSDKALDWRGPQFLVSTSHQMTTDTIAFDDIASDAFIELFTSGSTGQPKQIAKPVTLLDQEAKMLAGRFAYRLQGCRIVASVMPLHLYGLTFRIFLPMALGLPLHAAMLWYAEQLAALSHGHRYAFVSSPAFLKRLDPHLTPPSVAMILSAGGMLPWQDVEKTFTWLNIWPDEIYGSTETGILAWRYRQQDNIPWFTFPEVHLSPEDENVRVFSPLIPAEGLVLDDMLQFNENGQFHLLGRRDRVVKIEEKRISLNEVEQRLLALDGILDVAAIPLMRGGRQAIGVVFVLNEEARQKWQYAGRKAQELSWRRALLPWLESVAVPRYWRIVDEIPVNSMNKRIYAQLQELFHETP